MYERALLKLTRGMMEHSMTLAWQSGIAQHCRWRNGWLEEGSSESCAFLAMEPRNAELEKPPPKGIWPGFTIFSVAAVGFDFLGGWLKSKIATAQGTSLFGSQCLQIFSPGWGLTRELHLQHAIDQFPVQNGFFLAEGITSNASHFACS